MRIGRLLNYVQLYCTTLPEKLPGQRVQLANNWQCGMSARMHNHFQVLSWSEGGPIKVSVDMESDGIQICTGTDIRPIWDRDQTHPYPCTKISFHSHPFHPVFLPFPHIPAELPFHLHPSPQRFISIPISSMFVQQSTDRILVQLSCST